MSEDGDVIEDRLRRTVTGLDDTFADVDVTAAVMARLRTRRRVGRAGAVRRPALAAAAVIAVVVGVVLGVPSTRSTIARWFGFGAVEVRFDPPPVELTLPASPPVGAALFGAPVTAGEAERRTGLPVPVVEVLGHPDAIYLDTHVERGGIIAVYAASPTVPAGSVDDVGVIVQVVRGRVDGAAYVKYAQVASVVETSVHGEPALFVGGDPHPIVYLDSTGDPVHDTARLSGPTLLWDMGGMTLRLESSLPLEQAVALAESIDSTEP